MISLALSYIIHPIPIVHPHFCAVLWLTPSVDRCGYSIEMCTTKLTGNAHMILRLLTLSRMKIKFY
jgi:hypothetical protein